MTESSKRWKILVFNLISKLLLNVINFLNKLSTFLDCYKQNSPGPLFSKSQWQPKETLELFQISVKRLWNNF